MGGIRTAFSRNFKELIAFPSQPGKQLAAGGGTCNGFRGGSLSRFGEVLSFLRFPGTPSGRCKENIENSCDALKCGRFRCISSPRREIPHPGNRHQRDIVVWLIVYYVIFMIAGDLAAYAIGLVTEREFGGQVSLIVFLVLYFLFLWVSWVLAVWMTEPKHTEPMGPRSA